jgi:hypothetical protein
MTERLETVSVRLTPADRLALQTEALRRVRRGEAPKIDASAIVRELVRAGLKRPVGGAR